MWAKTNSQYLAEIWRSFLRGFCVAFPPVISHHHGLWWTIDWEHVLTDNVLMNSFQVTLLRKVYTIEEAATLSSPKGHAVLVLPADSRLTLPGWTVTQVTRNSSEVFTRVSNALQPYGEDGLKILANDILDDTCKAVLHGLVKEADLKYLKLLLKERAKIFGVPFQPRTIEVRGTKKKRDLPGVTT
ncbi:hypothetical protein Moror_7669 [Moniliophthora roreri MCA 2997]|uniref:Uncharacterized protein n=2 Tax=Moniliophthora roreri TaxID=221103 RepID=V2XBU4_MONRO|nr:hypothetical protein Moror_7669 [Moniliophthora roreri MCA 2997]